MIDFDSREEIKKLDKSNALDSIGQLPQQCLQAWQEASDIFFPARFSQVKNIVLCGMGGSAFGARIAKSLYDGAEINQVPIEVVTNYWLPGFVDKETLVVLSSYSGNTQETLECAHQAEKNGALISGITRGGILGKFFKQKNYPAYIFEAVYNKSGQPRFGSGYMVIGLLALLARLGFVPVSVDEVTKMVTFLQQQQRNINFQTASGRNLAKQLASRLAGKIPIIIVADFLEGAAHAVRNLFQETAKQFVLYFGVPELNHHLLEGLGFPKENKDLLKCIFVDSSIYDKRNRKRLVLTKEMVEKNEIDTEMLTLSGYSALTQTMELVQLGTFVAFYLAMVNGVDPSKIPWVDFFKKQLKK